MSRITVEVESTVGSSIGKRDHEEPDLGKPGRTEPDLGKPGGWPVGKGRVEDTLAPDGRSVRTLVLMREPARAGDEVTAWPVALLHLNDGRHDVDEVVCVAEAEPFVDLVDATDLDRWHAEPGAWVTALDRLSPGTRYRVTGYGDRREADQLVADAHRAYLRLTGCLE